MKDVNVRSLMLGRTVPNSRAQDFAVWLNVQNDRGAKTLLILLDENRGSIGFG